MGYDLGISTLDPYAEYFGLGTTTGVELGEATGIMSNPQEYRENHGVEWTDGVTSQTAIGQADNMFTPIQLAAMCATIANGGVRLQTHFLDKITDYTGETVIEEYQPVELYDAGISSDVLGVVQTGMQMVATQGTAADVFANYPVSIACKTGTAETSTPDENGNKPTEPNLSFICYAPANDPEIAVAVMIEQGNSGNCAKNVAKDILDQYFGFYTWDEEGNKFDQEGNQVDDDGQVIKPLRSWQKSGPPLRASRARKPPPTVRTGTPPARNLLPLPLRAGTATFRIKFTPGRIAPPRRREARTPRTILPERRKGACRKRPPLPAIGLTVPTTLEMADDSPCFRGKTDLEIM